MRYNYVRIHVFTYIHTYMLHTYIHVYIYIYIALHFATYSRSFQILSFYYVLGNHIIRSTELQALAFSCISSIQGQRFVLSRVIKAQFT